MKKWWRHTETFPLLSQQLNNNINNKQQHNPHDSNKPFPKAKLQKRKTIAPSKFGRHKVVNNSCYKCSIWPPPGHSQAVVVCLTKEKT